MFKAIKYFSTTLLALAVIVLILPYFIKLNSYKTEISQKALEVIGRDVTVEGDIKFSILPRPFLKLTDLKVSSLKGAQEPIMASLKEVEVVVAILPLLSGKIEVSKVILDKPSIVLEKLPSGKANWDFDIKVSHQGSLSTPSQDNTEGGASAFLVKHVEITEGALTYLDTAGRTDVKDINLTVDLDSLKGPIDFNLTLQVLGEKAVLSGQLKEIGTQIPLEAKLKFMGKKMKFGGIFDTAAQTFKGNVDLKGSLKDLQGVLPLTDVPSFMLEPYSFKAQLDASAKAISLHHIDFTLSPLVATGSAVYDFDRKISTLKLDLNPGGVHIDVQPMATKKAIFAGSLAVSAQDIKQFMSLLKVKTEVLPSFLLSSFTFNTHVVYANQLVDLKNMSLAMGTAQISGDLLLENWAENASCQVDLKTKDLAALASLMKVKVPVDLGPAKIVGSASGLPISDKKNPLTVDMAVFAANAETKLKGTIALGSQMKPDLQVSSKGSSLRSTLMAAGQKNPSSNLGAFSVQAHVKGDIPQMVSIGLQPSFMTLGRERLDLKGSVNLTLGGVKPKVTANLHVSTLNLDRLLASSSRYIGETAAPWSVHLVGTRGVKATEPTPSSTSKWSHEKIDLSALRDFDGDITLAIPKVQKGSLVFDSIATTVRIANGVLDLTSFKANLYGGALSLKARVSSQKNQAVTLSAQLKNAQLRNISPEKNTIKVISGLFSCEADLTTQGQSEYQYVSNLSGSVNFSGQQGVISGFNLQKIVADLENSKDLGTALRLLNSAFSGGQTSFNSIECLAAVNKGEARITKFLMDAPGVKATADGSVNILKYWMDISSVVTLGSGKLPSFSARIYGPLDNPSNQLKTGKLEQYLLQNVVSGVVDSISKSKGRPEDLIKGILGLGQKGGDAPIADPEKGTAPAPAPDQTPQQQRGDPLSQAVGGLLKGILK